MEKLLD